jgi:L-iditol 2-dehydrogenase
MLAGYLIAPTQIELRDLPIPEPAPGEVVVRVRVALTDGTDLKAYRRGHPQMPMPTRFGHEFSGDVAAVGAGVTRFAPGDAIMSVHSAPCAACWWCAHDEAELCAHVMETKILGAYAEFIVLPPHIVACNAYAKPAHLSYEAAAFLEPLACVVHSVAALDLKRDASVAIVGDGGFGILHALVAATCTDHPPILIGRRAARLAVARSYGTFEVIDATDRSSDDIAEMVRERTGGRGVDAAIESTGTQSVWESAPDLVRRGGTVSLFGGLPTGTRVSFSAARLHYDEVKLISPFHFGPRAVRGAYDLLDADAIDVAPLIDERFRLADLESAFARLDAGDGLKYAIVP